jgi:hypothetical protein
MDEKLRPLTLGEILDRTTRLYRHNFWTFAGVAAVPMVVSFAVVLPILIALGAMGLFNPKAADPSVGAIVALVAGGILIGFPLLIVASVVEQVALTNTAISLHNGSKLKVREAIKSSWPRFWRYLWLIVLKGVLVGVAPAAVGGGVIIGLSVLTTLAAAAGAKAASVFIVILVVLIVFGIVVYMIWAETCFSMGISACLAEEKPGWQSIKRAYYLSKGTRGRIFVMYLLVIALYGVITMVVDIAIFIAMAIMTSIGHSKGTTTALVVVQILNFASNLTIQTLIAPVSVIALVLFYYDQRVRTEGYDIELMMQQAGLTSLPVATKPSTEPEPPAVAPTIPVPENPLTPAPESPLKPSFEQGPGTDNLKEQ